MSRKNGERFNSRALPILEMGLPPKCNQYSPVISKLPSGLGLLVDGPVASCETED